MFSQRLKELRKERGLSQALIGKHLNVTQQAVARWEKGDAEPDLKQLVRLSELLRCDVNFLIGSSNELTDNGVKDTDEDSIKPYAAIWYINKERGHKLEQYPPEAIDELETFFNYIEYKYSINK